MSKRLVFTNTSGAVKVTLPLLPQLPGEPEAVWLERVAFAVTHADPRWEGWTYRGGVEEAALPSRATHLLPGAPTYALPNSQGKVEERYLHDRPCWVWQSGGVALSAERYGQQLVDLVREERNRRLVESDGKKSQLEDTGNPVRVNQYRTYRQQLRDLPAAVTSGVAGQPWSGVVAYTPPWPTDPEAP